MSDSDSGARGTNDTLTCVGPTVDADIPGQDKLTERIGGWLRNVTPVASAGNWHEGEMVVGDSEHCLRPSTPPCRDEASIRQRRQAASLWMDLPTDGSHSPSPASSPLTLIFHRGASPASPASSSLPPSSPIPMDCNDPACVQCENDHARCLNTFDDGQACHRCRTNRLSCTLDVTPLRDAPDHAPPSPTETIIPRDLALALLGFAIQDGVLSGQAALDAYENIMAGTPSGDAASRDL
ncbi:hypothetical protein CYLTODRAFT_458707 [Cylindrobasidium torrendii FP15055 ss-10]|uniref:Zn(2)-C6 fungal-type domain-containing protein n=1 Tax=Cylindrobasidium torrendii FP15055 ss-10 TaxID=1314674 RepID=A0A0D7AZS7_9AGAR|nr:hypothetical protein CYLTODRAFT_458707 [Cylindrobasidium torrendii FP15055 ss-10]